MTLPNFLVVGAAKAGTTFLYRLLEQHPDVFLSANKEPRFLAFEGGPPPYRGPGDERFFNRPTVTTLEGYAALFSGAVGRRAVGEASTHYLYGPEAPAGILRHVPEARLIALFRNPVDRAYSSFLHARRDGREPLSDFAAALDAEEERIEAGWGPLFHYRRMGRHAEQVERYREAFGPERLHAFLYDDLRDDPLAVFRAVCGLLGIDEREPDLRLSPNVGGEPRSRRLQAALDRPHAAKRAVKRLLPAGGRRLLERRLTALRRRNLRRPPMDPGLRRELTASFEDDVRRLETLLGRDLSGWLSP